MFGEPEGTTFRAGRRVNLRRMQVATSNTVKKILRQFEDLLEAFIFFVIMFPPLIAATSNEAIDDVELCLLCPT